MVPTGLGAIPPFAPMFQKALGLWAPRQGASPQVTFDTIGDHGAGAAATTGGSSLTWTHIIGDGPNRAVYVGVGVGASPDTMTTSVTFGGVAMTSVNKTHAAASTGGYVELFRVLAPPIARATVVVTVSAAPIEFVAGSASFFNVDQTTPETITAATGTGTLASVANPGGPGDLALLLVGGGSALNATPNNSSLLWAANRSASNQCGNIGMSQTAGGAGLIETWTLVSDSWGAIGASLKGTVAADPTFTIDTPIWTGDYESGDLSQQFLGGNGSYLPSTPTVITSSPTPQQGTYAGKYVVPAGTNVAGGTTDPRCEDTWNRQTDIKEGDDLWFGGWVMIDSTFVDPAAGEFCVITQWKNEGTGSPPIELMINNDTTPCHWRIDGGSGYPTGSQQWVALDSTSIPIVRNVWVRWDFHIVFSSNPALAQLNVWKDGVQVVTNYAFPTLAGTMYPNATSYWKRGIYRSHTKTTQDIIYHDGWLAGRTATSVAFPTAPPPVALTDTGSGTDALVASVAAAISETAAGTDALTATVGVQVADVATGVDAMAVAPSVPLDQTAVGSDALTVSVAVTLAETATGTDALGVAQGSNPALPETTTGTDALAVTAGSVLSDAWVGTDALTATATGAVSDTGHGSDSLTVAVSVTLGDTGSLTDSMSLATGGNPSLADSVGAVDNLSIVVTVPTLTESISLTEGWTASGSGILAMTYLYTPPTWSNPIPMGGALVVHGIPTATLVYRQGGVWFNKFMAGIDDPVVANCDVDPSGLLLFFTTPTVIPNTLYAELSAVAPVDPSWSPGTLTPLP